MYEIKLDTINWLLSESDPLVKLSLLSDQSLNDKINLNIEKEIEALKQLICTSGIVPKIFHNQNVGGYWGNPQDFYIRSKYKGTVWSILLLAELNIPGNDPRIKNATEFLLKWAQDRKSGGFAYMGTEQTGGIHDDVIPCLTGNLTWAMIRFGYRNDPRVHNAFEWITHYLRFDDGKTSAPTQWPYRFEKCWGKHTCMMGVVKCLKALAEIPPSQRSSSIQKTIEQATKFIINHHLYQKSHQLGEIGNPNWIQLGFPRFWKTDLLEMLDILIKLEIYDSQMQDAIEILEKKMKKDQKWILEDTWNGRMRVLIEKKNEPSKWITLQALRVLNKWYN